MARFLLARGAVYLMIAQAVLMLFGYVINFWLGRYLGVTAYGSYGIIMAIATIMNLLLAPGITQGVSKILAENRTAAAAIKKQVLRFLLIFAIGLGVVYFFLSQALAHWLKDPSLTGYLQVLTLMVPAYIFTAAFSGYLTGTKKFAEQAWVPVVYATTRLVLTFALAFFFLLKGAVIAFVGASIATMLYAMKAASSKDAAKQNPMPDALSTIKKNVPIYLLLLALFYGLHTLLVNLDLFFVKALSESAVTAGYYTAASTVSKIPYLIMNTLSLLIMPVVTEAMTEGREKTRKIIAEMIRYVILLLVPSTLIITLTAQHTISLLYKSTYLPGAAPLMILASSMALATLLVVTLTVAIAAGNITMPLILIALSTAAAAVLNRMLIPTQGMMGAAWAMLITFIPGMAVSIIYLIAKFRTFLPTKTVIRITAASAAVYLVATRIHFNNKFLVVPEYVALLAVFGIVLLITREINKNDIERIKSFIPWKKAA